MNKDYTVQFYIGIAGIFSSLIWIMVKFGLLSFTNFEWLSISLISFSLALSYHFINREINSLIMLSVLCFFISISFLVYFILSETEQSRLDFNINYFFYSIGFTVGTFFLIKSFASEKKLNLVLSATLYFFTLVGFFALPILSKLFNLQIIDNLISSITEVNETIINLLILLLIIFPVVNILNELKKLREGHD